MGLVHCQGCNRLVSEFLQACPSCRHPVVLEVSGGRHFSELWLLVGKAIFGLALGGLMATFVVGSHVLADFFTRLTLLTAGLLAVGKAWQWLRFKRRDHS